MNKELPKMYQTKINKTVPSIQKVYSTIGKDTDRKENTRSSRYATVSVEQKLDDIFSAPDYVYKADVTIVTDTETIQRRIVAKNHNNVITIDNEYIPISLIRDIYKSE